MEPGLAPDDMARESQFLRADAYRDLREAEPHEISQKRAFSHNFDNY
jgi:hypothetical protein